MAAPNGPSTPRPATPSIRVPPTGVVYAATGGGEIFAVDAGTGKQRWREDADTTFSAQPAVGKDRVYLSGDDSALHAYRIDDGDRHWRVATDGEIRTSPTLVGDVAVVADIDGRLYMASSRGSLRRTRLVGPVVGDPISTGDAACVPLADGSVRCVRTADGKKLARITLPGTKLSAPARGDGVVFAAGADGTVGAWEKETGVRRWVFRPAKPAAAAAHLGLGVDRVVAAYPDGRLIGLDAGTGTRQWEIALPDHFDEGPRLDKTAMYIVGRTGTLYALQAPGFAGRAAPAPDREPNDIHPAARPDRRRRPSPRIPPRQLVAVDRLVGCGTSPIAWSRISRPRSDLLPGGGQRRRDPEHPAHPGQLHHVHVQAQLQAAPGDRRAQLVRALLGLPVQHQLQPDQQPSAAHVADHLVPRGHLQQPVPQELAQRQRRPRPACRARARPGRCCRPPRPADPRRAW